MEYVVAMLVFNTILIVLYIVKYRRDKKAYPFLLLFFAVPIFGMALYYIPQFIFKRWNKQDLYNKEDIISMNGIEDYAIRPKIEEEMNIIPFEEAMTISGASEKRGLLLGLLKSNMGDNIKVTLSALEDNDSETSHYAAAATMEIARKLRASIQEAEEEFLKNSNDPVMMQSYLDKLFHYIESGILSERDRLIQINKYMKLAEQRASINSEQVPVRDYTRHIQLLMEINQLYDAERIALEGLMKYEEEDIYLLLMELYFRMKNHVKFSGTLTRLRKSQVVLSEKGIDTVRFWIARG